MVKHPYICLRNAIVLSASLIFCLPIQSEALQFNLSNKNFGLVPFPGRFFQHETDFTVTGENQAVPNLAEGNKPAPMALDAVMRLIGDAASRHNVPAAFVSSIVAAESNFSSDAVSPKGAIGLMQLMPATAQMLGADPKVPAQNVDAGTHYLRVLMDRYQRHSNFLPKVIAAYNAGPGMVDKYHGVPPFRETRNYVHRVLTFFRYFEKR